MDYLTSAIKLLGILAALVAVRLIVQATMRRRATCAPCQTGGGFLRAITSYTLPPLITGGPGFLGVSVFLCSLRCASVPSHVALLGLAGGVMLAFGLVIMLGMLGRQQRAISELEKRVAGGHGDEG